MSRKNRAFALAVATAALVGVSAPVASAASFDGPNNNGVNNNLVNVSGNQVAAQACAVGAALNAVNGVQALSGIAGFGPVVNTGHADPAQGNNCTQNPTQAS